MDERTEKHDSLYNIDEETIKFLGLLHLMQFP